MDLDIELDDDVIAVYERWAKLNGRTVEEEIREALTQAVLKQKERHHSSGESQGFDE